MTKKQIIQLLVLILFLYFGVYLLLNGVGIYKNLWEYGYNYYFVLITMLLLIGVYVVYSQTDYKFVKYLRILLYFITFFIVFNRIKTYYYIYRFYTVPLDVDFYWLNVFSKIGSFFISFPMILAVLISGALIFNKPFKSKNIKIGRFKISL